MFDKEAVEKIARDALIKALARFEGQEVTEETRAEMQQIGTNTLMMYFDGEKAAQVAADYINEAEEKATP